MDTTADEALAEEWREEASLSYSAVQNKVGREDRHAGGST